MFGLVTHRNSQYGNSVWKHRMAKPASTSGAFEPNNMDMQVASRQYQFWGQGPE